MLENGERQVAPELSGIRRDHVARYELAEVIASGSRVLDIACGVGYGSNLLAKRGAVVVGVDRSKEAIEYAAQHYAHENCTFIRSEVDDYDSEQPFDAAVCFETIEHLHDPLPLLSKLRRLAPILFASVPNEAVFPHEGKIKFHFRHYTREDFAALLAAAGWEVTGWYGQEGRESEVVPGLEGRTLIVTAKRAAEVALQDVPPAQADKAVPQHVSIIGLGPSCATFFEMTRRLGGVSAYCDEVWGINAIGDVLNCDRVFHMDDVRIQEARAAANPGGNIRAMVDWLKHHPGPVYTSVVRPGYPGLVAFPLEEVLNAGPEGNGGAPYFNSTAAYAIAYAIHIGVKHISLFGLDYTLANSHRAEKGRGCCEFWLGIAAARGIELTIPDTSSLLDACEPPRARLYGYDCVDVALEDQADGKVRVKFSDRADVPTAAEVEKAYDHSLHPNPLMKAAG